ncbi:hypothetical protein FNV43_RR15672 [Rhamnella rubrinervis]|uniref:Protein CHUP1, chloroplastic n=1 Tax=Rhamnella rubrinervis TaxID=2594499 RepID=A0A8K0ED22_9ROSA|nr:hypothetical protein FNV43_RR15672 [Rhamnella rubrinervis]
MEGSTSKAEIMKPVILKAGIPLALSVAGYLCAKLMARRCVPKDPLFENQPEIDSQLRDDQERFHSFGSSTSLPSIEYEKPMAMDTDFKNSTESFETEDEPSVEEELLRLRSRIEDLQKREWELETQFLRYCDLKEQDCMLMQLENTLSFEMSQVEFLDKEIASMEAEKNRLETLVVEYLRVLELVEFWKSKNGFLHRKVKKLLRRIKVQSSRVREQGLKIEAREAVILRTHDVLEKRTNIIKELEDEVQELKMKLDDRQEEKNELLKMLELAEKSNLSISKNEAEGITMEDYDRLSNELEQLQKDRAAEVKELIYLRWSSACLRHELMKNQEHQEQIQRKDHLEIDFEGNLIVENYGSEQELEGMIMEQNGDYFDTATGEQVHSKRRKLLQRLRRWVEGSENKGKAKLIDHEKESHEVKCFRRHSVSDESEEHLQARRSCSSAGP